MNVPHCLHTATLLPSGNVLPRPDSPDGTAKNTAEIYSSPQ